ncbi:FAD-binding protein [Microbacterium sp. SORGH_AS_0862]|uniref:FAD-binding protein n=1 Tax=Microbacterium sp. SORGH_AS_0862 TaxID=3041789 RepID=UPI0027912006|nr:FAD-binding protein [Microbacterium sp. SORGH_AS_0862]MDQ1206635.1 xylitol oxidase [Microbacterium sp. SORGH_AS_0862]
MTLHNWAGNLTYAGELVSPTTREEAARAVRDADAVRALGTRHSFSAIADTPGILLSTAALPARVEIDPSTRIARVSGGLRYGDVAERLQAEGWALGNLASLPHFSVAGAIATGTHGSGDHNRSLAGSVAGVEILLADGTIRWFRRGDAEFPGVVVSLGALGVVLDVELDVQPTYDIAQTVYERVPWDAALADLAAVTSLGHSVSLFSTWTDPDVADQLWLKARVGEAPAPASVLGAAPASTARHPLPGVSAENCTVQGGVAGPWLERLPHFRLGFTPSQGDELQSEYFVDRRDAPAAIRALRELSPQLVPLLLVNEVRTIAADDLWLSGAYGRYSIGLHFTWRRDEDAVRALLPRIEDALAPYAARPHWGKVFTMAAADIRARYPRFDDAVALRERLDPAGTFRNAFLAALGF